MQSSFTCLQPDEVKKFIAGDMPPQRVDEVEDHLSTCQACRRSLEATVGDRDWWQDLQVALQPDADDCEDKYSEPTESVCQRLTALLGPTDDPSMLGRIGSYEILGLLGYGGMGAVFKARDPGLNRYVAIKILLPHLALSGAARARFRREGQAAAAIIDDCVLPIYAVDEWQGIPYLVMQYTRGVSLQRRIQDRGALELKEILRIGMQAARGLAAAHAQGLVHRDVKPANILLDGSVDRALLTDFGLARAADDASLTASGIVAGTPQYMSPEQARAETVDHRSDLFSLGSVMYAMCTGHAPFRAESSYAVLRLITDKEPRPIREINPEIPDWLCSMVRKLMAKQVGDRMDSAKELAELLKDCLAHVQSSNSPLPEAVYRPTTTRRIAGKHLFIGVVTMSCLIAIALLVLVLTQAPPNNDGAGTTGGAAIQPSSVPESSAGSEANSSTAQQADSSTPDAIQNLLPSLVVVTRVEPAPGDPAPLLPKSLSHRGVIVDSRGYIAIPMLPGPAKQFVVTLPNQQKTMGELVAIDESLKVGLVKITQTLPVKAISLDIRHKSQVADRVLLVPSSPGEQASSGRITSVTFTPDEDGLASFIQSNIACPLSEFGSLMVSEAGEPIGLVLTSRSNFLPGVRRQEMEPTSIAVPLQAIQTVLQAALDKPKDVPLVRLPSSRAIDINKPVSITLVPTTPLAKPLVERFASRGVKILEHEEGKRLKIEAPPLVLQELANLLSLVAREEGTDSGNVDRSTLLKIDLQPATPLAKSLVELFAKRGATVLIYEEGNRLQVEAPPKTMEDLNRVFQFLQDPVQR